MSLREGRTRAIAIRRGSYTSLLLLNSGHFVTGKSLDNLDKLSKMSPRARRPWDPKKSQKSLGDSPGSLQRVSGMCLESVFGVFRDFSGDFSGSWGWRPQETFSRLFRHLGPFWARETSGKGGLVWPVFLSGSPLQCMPVTTPRRWVFFVAIFLTTLKGGHATTRFLEGFLEGSLTISAS